MFRRRKQLPWYWRVIGILIVLRVLYFFVRFFMKIVDVKGWREDNKRDNNKEKPGIFSWVKMFGGQ